MCAAASDILAVEQLTRDFPAVRALDDVSLGFRAGEIHCIVGENGAGKSTLMKTLAGLYEPTAGRVLLDGKPIATFRPAAAMRMGISMVHQELNLIPELSVAENIHLGREQVGRCCLVRRREQERSAADLLARVGAKDIRPGQKVRELSIAGQQMVEIAKSLSFEARVLILDEPTAVLTHREVEKLFALIARLRESGVTVLYISHILPEVLRINDRVTVMRDGQIVRTLTRDEVGQGPPAERMLGSLMVGRELGDHFPARPARSETPLLTVEGLRVAECVHDVGFELRAGEILGFAGLVGSGRTELAEALVGLRARRAGRIVLDGTEIAPQSVRQAMDAGLAYVSEDRRERGLVMGRSIRENLSLAALEQLRFGRFWVDRAAERQAVREQIEAMSIKIGRPDDAIGTLSGGNQQKVALGKWLLTNPRVLLLDEPTRGVDIGAKEEIYRLIAGLAKQGMGCLFISSELTELLGTCHRIAVMRAGRLAGILEGDQMTEQNVMFLAAGVETEDAA